MDTHRGHTKKSNNGNTRASAIESKATVPSEHAKNHGNHNVSDTRGGNHHARMAADFRRRFWVSVALTVPILVLAPLIQQILGLEAVLQFPGAKYMQFAFATAVFFYGGRPFLIGFVDELAKKSPGMMTLIAVAIITAYFYSSLVVFGLHGKVFFWELATLIDIMLAGHGIEMRSTVGASGALEKLVKLIPSEAHRLAGDDTYLSQVVEMVQAAQASKSKAQNLDDRAAFWLTLLAMSAGPATLFA